MIKTYANESAWASATKPTTESTVGLLLDSNTPVINGVNVLVTIPKYGDAVVLDADGNIRFIAFGTFNNAIFPSSWTKVGVVYWVQGKDVRFISHTSLGGKKYSDVWRLKITGYTLDSTDRSGVLTTYDNNGTTTTLTFNYNASTKADFVSQFNTWAATSGNDPNSRSYYMYVDSNGDVEFVEGNYNNRKQHSDKFSSGLSSAANVAQEIPAFNWSLDMDGYNRVYNTVNIGAIKRWGGRTLSSEEAVSTNGTPISQASFNGKYGVNYRAIYSSYDEYLEHNQVKIPVNRGVASWRDVGHQYTYALANNTYTKKDGTSDYMYTAARSAATFGYSANANVAAGKWYIPDVEEMTVLMRPITVGNRGISTVDQYDKVNQTIYAMGGNIISTNAPRWCSCRCTSDVMWFYHLLGHLANDYFCNPFTLVPVCRLLIP